MSAALVFPDPSLSLSSLHLTLQGFSPCRLSKSQHSDLRGSAHRTWLTSFDEAKNGICQTSQGLYQKWYKITPTTCDYSQQSQSFFVIRTEENGETNANPWWENGKVLLQVCFCSHLGKIESATYIFMKQNKCHPKKSSRKIQAG